MKEVNKRQNQVTGLYDGFAVICKDFAHVYLKHKWPVLIAVILLVFAAAGCGGGSENVSISAAAAAEKILNEVQFSDTLTLAQSSAAENFYDLDDNNIEEYAVYISSGATAEEIAVIKMKEGGISSARLIMETRIEEQKFRYESYVPAEMEKLENPVIASKGNMIIMILADDMAAAEKVAEEILK